MQKVFDLTNKYIVLTTPLILYTLFSTMYLATAASGGKLINILFAIILFTLMTCAFMAGWFNMIKLAVSTPEREDPNSLLKDFVGGVGEYFLPSLGSLFVMFVVSTIALIASYFIGMNTIGNIGISAEALSNAMQTTAALKSFVSGLSIEQLTKINLWNMLLLSFIMLTYFLFFLYMPALFFKNKNPFIAFFVCLKDLFSKKIGQTVGIFLLIFVVNFFISLFSTLFGRNVVMHFVMTLLNFYFVTAVGVGVFYYYFKSFVKPAIGQNVDLEI